MELRGHTIVDIQSDELVDYGADDGSLLFIEGDANGIMFSFCNQIIGIDVENLGQAESYEGEQNQVVLHFEISHRG